MNSFVEGDQFKCPIKARNYSVGNFDLNNELIPIHLFYKPRSYFWANGSFTHVAESSTMLIGCAFYKLRIVKNSAKKPK